MPGRMPVPKGPIDEESYAEAGPSEIWGPRCLFVVGSPATDASRVERPPEGKLWVRILALDSSHDPAALGLGTRVHRPAEPASGARNSLPKMPASNDARSDGAQSRRPLAVDLFAGAGGLTLGLEQAGFDVVTAVEYDPVHAATHEYNFPHCKVLCADIAAPLQSSTVEAAIREGIASHGKDPNAWDGEIDLIAGGPPCQGFSMIGKRLVDDYRNQLVFHFYRLISALRPKYFIMENVPGMAKGGHAGILDGLIAEFEDKAGYRFPADQPYEILNAADFGVPQERHRLFLIGTRKDQSKVAKPPAPTVQPVPKRATGEHVLGTELPGGPTVADAILDLPNLARFASLAKRDETRLSSTALQEMEREASPYARVLRGAQLDPQDFSRPRKWDKPLLTASMRTDHTPQSIRRFKVTKPGETEPISRFYKLDPMGLCNTLRAGSGSERGAFTSPRPLHPFAPRVLSNREAARLHSFPDWFRPHATKWHGFRQIGNAVAPLVGRAAGSCVLEALEVRPCRPKEDFELGDPTLLTFSMQEAAAHFEVDLDSIPAPRQRGAGRTRLANSRHGRSQPVDAFADLR